MMNVGYQLGLPGIDMIQDIQLTNQFADYLKKWDAGLLPKTVLQRQLPQLGSDYEHLFFKGNLDLLKLNVVSVVGTRNPSEEGILRAKKVSSVLCELDIPVMSGLAKGIDTVAHKAALSAGGATIAVLGTPIHKIYPAENKALAAEIADKGLLVSTSTPEEEHGKFLFPRRNRLMAKLSVATIVIEAGPTSGVIHQASECLKQGRKLIFLKSLATNQSLPWVPGFINSGAIVVETADELKSVLG